MIVKSLALSDFRNYDLQELSFHHGINIFYGDNAQGKTNILEGIYLCMTNKSYRGSHDREMIRFGKEEAHLRLEAEKKGIPYRVDMHLKKSKKPCHTPDNRDRDKRANCPAEQQIPRLYAEQIPDGLPPGDAPCRKSDGKRTNLHPAGRQPCTRLFRHLCVENALNTHQCAGKQRC